MQQKLFDDSKDRNKNQIQVYFDGLCQPCNPGGTACYAHTVKNGENTIHRKFGVAAYNSTNNVAVYTAIIRALEWLLANNYQNEKIIVIGDYKLVIRQIERNSKVKAPNIIPLYHNAMSLTSNSNIYNLNWYPENKTRRQINYLIMRTQKL